MSSETKCILDARAILSNQTPLKTDCGSLCCSACCQGDDTTGMLLFPGEEELLESVSFGRILTTHYSIGDHAGKLFVCSGNCDRSLRPLSCRIFPLFPALTAAGTISVRMDPRAKPLCPLARMPLLSLSRDFIDSVAACGNILCSNSEIHAFLHSLTAAVFPFDA